MISNLFACDWLFTNLLRCGNIKEYTSVPAQRSCQKGVGTKKYSGADIIGFDQSKKKFILVSLIQVNPNQLGCLALNTDFKKLITSEIATPPYNL